MGHWDVDAMDLEESSATLALSKTFFHPQVMLHCCFLESNSINIPQNLFKKHTIAIQLLMPRRRNNVSKIYGDVRIFS
jgi:hypothetical protein